MDPTKVTIGEVRFSYLHVFKPEATAEGAEKKYSVSLIIPKSNTELVARIKAAIDKAFNDGIATKFGGKRPAVWKNPLRDGDLERPDDEAYANAYFVNASSKNQPGIVKPNPSGMTKFTTITDEQELFSGCYGYASVNFFPFANSGNKGVAAGLNNILKTREGDFLGGRASAESDFSGLSIPGLTDITDPDDIF